MKRYLSLCIIPFIMLAGAFSTARSGGSVFGRINPHNAALHVWAVSDNDTSRATIQNGEFEIKNLRSGRYRLIIDGRYPYKITTRPDILVSDSAATNVGEIVLDKN